MNFPQETCEKMVQTSLKRTPQKCRQFRDSPKKRKFPKRESKTNGIRYAISVISLTTPPSFPIFGFNHPLPLLEGLTLEMYGPASTANFRFQFIQLKKKRDENARFSINLCGIKFTN